MRYIPLLVVVCLFAISWSVGIGATTGIVKIYAEPGNTAYSRTLKLINPDGNGKHFVVDVTQSVQKKQYLPIENISWVKVVPETVFVPAKGRSEPIEIVVQIPDSDIYYNRRFICRVEISQKSVSALSTGLVIPVYIDTKADRNIPPVCDGCGIVVYPHKLTIEGKLDSLTIVNWTDDTAKITIGWNQPDEDDWKKAFEIFENILGGFIPINDTLVLMPRAKKNIFIKPIVFPGRGMLYFSDVNGNLDFTDLIWGNW